MKMNMYTFDMCKKTFTSLSKTFITYRAEVSPTSKIPVIKILIYAS